MGAHIRAPCRLGARQGPVVAEASLAHVGQICASSQPKGVLRSTSRAIERLAVGI